jgi:hypothetical protein
MKLFLVVSLLLALGTLGIQMFFYQAYKIKKRTRAWHERQTEMHENVYREAA